MTQYSFFGVNGNSATGPGSSISYGGAFVGGLQFEVTSSGQYLYGYYMWRADSAQSASASFALWIQTAGAAGTFQSGTDTSTSSMTAGQWNYAALGTPFALSTGVVYKAVYGLTGNFNDTHDQFNTAGGVYPAGIVNGPITCYSDQVSQGGTNPAPIASGWQGTFDTSGSDPTTNFPSSTDGSANFWIDILAGPATASFTAAPNRPRGQAVNRASTY